MRVRRSVIAGVLAAASIGCAVKSARDRDAWYALERSAAWASSPPRSRAQDPPRPNPSILAEPSTDPPVATAGETTPCPASSEPAPANDAVLNDLSQRFQAMVEAGKVRIAFRRNRPLLELADDLLFESGRTTIKPAGRAVLVEVAGVLATIPERKLVVAGHTDNVRIRSSRYESNWDLATARALEVTRVLVAHGVAPKIVATAGYAEFEPVASNDTPAGRAKNRRIEIEVVPIGSERQRPIASFPPATAVQPRLQRDW